MSIFKTITSPVSSRHRNGIDKYLTKWLDMLHGNKTVKFRIWRDNAVEEMLHASIAASIVVTACDLEQRRAPGHLMGVFRREYDNQPDTDAVEAQRTAFLIGDGLITTDRSAWNPATQAGTAHQRAVEMGVTIYGMEAVLHGLEAVIADLRKVLASPLTSGDSYDVAVTAGELYFELVKASAAKASR